MKKQIRLLIVIIILYYTATITLPKFITSAAQKKHSEETYQTWEEFLESGVKIQYDEPLNTDDKND